MADNQSVVHAAHQKLSSSSHLFARCVECRYDRGVLTLSGRVPSFYLKQTAQSLIQGIEGVRRVNNALVVVSPRGVSSEPETAAAL